MKISDKTHGPSVVRGSQNSQHFTVQHSKLMFDVLSSRIYTDKVGAVIREITSNAIDAGGKAFISLPNYGSPNFKVKDNGPGISEDDMHRIYTVYFASTKRDDNDNIGGFGLGAKTPLAYTDSFSVRSVHGGFVCLYVVNRTEEGVPVLNLMHREASEEATGVEVSVPVPYSDFHEWEEKTRELCAWQEERVELVGNTTPIARPYQFRNERFAYNGEIKGVVVGGWFYELFLGYSNRHFIEYVPVGTVDIAVSREALELTKKTKEYIAAIPAKEYHAWLVGEVTKKIESEGTLFQRTKAYLNYSLFVQDVEFDTKRLLPVRKVDGVGDMPLVGFYEACRQGRKKAQNRSFRSATLTTLVEFVRYYYAHHDRKTFYINDDKTSNKIFPEALTGESYFFVDDSPGALAFFKEIGLEVKFQRISELPKKVRAKAQPRSKLLKVFRNLTGWRIRNESREAEVSEFPANQIYTIVNNSEVSSLAKAYSSAGYKIVGVSATTANRIPKTWVNVEEYLKGVVVGLLDEQIQVLEALQNDNEGWSLLNARGLQEGRTFETSVAVGGNSNWSVARKMLGNLILNIEGEIKARKLSVLRKKISKTVQVVLKECYCKVSAAELEKIYAKLS